VGRGWGNTERKRKRKKGRGVDEERGGEGQKEMIRARLDPTTFQT
jgi:hypothetical protein